MAVEVIDMSTSGNKGSGKGSGGRSRRTAMKPAAASRVQSAGARRPNSATATTGFAARAQSAAAKNTRPKN